MAGRTAAVPERPLGLPARFVILTLFVAGAIVGAPSVYGLYWFIPFAAVGALLIIRRPGMSIGWILFGLAWSFAIVTASVDATAQQFADGTVALPTALFAVAQSVAGTVGFFLFGLLAIVYPSGRLPGGRWGRATRVALSVCLILIAAALVMPVILVSLAGAPDSVPVANPFALGPDLAVWQRLADWQLVTPDTVIIPVMLLVVAGAISLIVRARRAGGIERQQLRWLGASIAAVVVAVTSGFILGIVVPAAADSGLIWIPALLTFPLVAVAVGVAVLRYRLYDIDRIISRTIAYGVLTGLLVGAYAVSILALQGPLGGLTGNDTLLVAISTLVVAALFQPLRRRVQTVVDRRFDRARFDAERTSAAFAERLRVEVDVAAVSTDLYSTIDEAIKPASVGLWLREPGHRVEAD